MNRHKQLVSDAKEAIDKVFSDTSGSQGTTRSSIEEIVEHAQESLDSLKVVAEDLDDLEADR
jgi:hypothetical protein